jgi:hypothetical protein
MTRGLKVSASMFVIALMFLAFMAMLAGCVIVSTPAWAKSLDIGTSIPGRWGPQSCEDCVPLPNQVTAAVLRNDSTYERSKQFVDVLYSFEVSLPSAMPGGTNCALQLPLPLTMSPFYARIFPDMMGVVAANLTQSMFYSATKSVVSNNQQWSVVLHVSGEGSKISADFICSGYQDVTVLLHLRYLAR